MLDLAALQLQDADTVCDLLHAGAHANMRAATREGSIDRIKFPGTLIATGDLHDNPLNLMRLVKLGNMDAESAVLENPDSPTHLVLHEVIHSDRLTNGMDFSYRGLTRIAALKAHFPERVHTLLANHELSQLVGAGIVKDGVRVVEAFNDAVNFAFGDDADRVNAAIRVFIRSMPLALRCVCPRGEFLVSHSLPPPAMMQRFDPSILNRELTDDDYEPRRGSAYIMVWGRGYDADLLEDLVERWGISFFIVGHEKADNGVHFVPPNAIVLNSDTDRGVYLPIDLSDPPAPHEAVAQVKRLRGPIVIAD